MTLLLLILILGLLIFIHELGHFLTAKKSGVFIYEFALGMGPRIISKKGKDDIIYSLRLFPIGGFVQMAGEVYEDDKKIKKEQFMCNRPWYQRVIILVAGVTMNFILALVLLFVQSLIWGNTELKPIIGTVAENYPASEAGIEVGDRIISINDHKTNSWDSVILSLNLKNKKDYYEIKVKKADNSIETYNIAPKEEKNEDGTTSKIFGIGVNPSVKKGFLNAINYSFSKFGSIINSMCMIIGNLFIGKLSISALSGPVGIYTVVGQSAALGLSSLIYLTAYLSINLGFMNILPFPAFDGGRVLFLIIEKIKGSPVDSKLENTFHTIGFILLMILMIYVTFQDIIKLF